MVKIGIISDTHGNLEEAKLALEKMGHIDWLIHLGDYYEDGIRLKECLHANMVMIKGNCDRGSKGEDEMVLDLEGVRLFITHGHQYEVKMGLNRLYYRALELGCQIALYGHTHIPENIKKTGLFILNPGSVAQPRGGSRASFGLIEIREGEITSEIIAL